MTDSEKLTALKKAYADTILNTVKEAAARVMISERKARGFQQELGAVRDEALRTCLRLKQMYDSKVKEAEMMCLSKQQKIEELEAQLGEAEDIVGELRMELRESRYYLVKLANSNEENEVVSLAREDSCNHEADGIKPHLSDKDISINRCSYKENKDEALKRNIAVESLTEARKEDDMELSTSKEQCVQFTPKRKCNKDARSGSRSPEGGSPSSQDDESWQKTGEKDNRYLDSWIPSIPDHLAILDVLHKSLVSFYHSQKRNFCSRRSRVMMFLDSQVIFYHQFHLIHMEKEWLTREIS